MQVPRTLPRPGHQNLWEGVGPGNLYLTTSLGESALLQPLGTTVPIGSLHSHLLPDPPISASPGRSLPLAPHPLLPEALQPEPTLSFSGCPVRLRRGLIVQFLLSAPAPPPFPPPGPQPQIEDPDGHSLWGVLGGEGPADSLTLAPQEGLSFRVLRPQEGIQNPWVFVTQPPQRCSTAPSTAPALSTPGLDPAMGPACPQTHRSPGQSGPEPWLYFFLLQPPDLTPAPWFMVQ